MSETPSATETLSAPYLLIATPTLLDPNFAQSVVLMGHHDTEGAMGWIVNRRHERPVRCQEQRHCPEKSDVRCPAISNGFVL